MLAYETETRSFSASSVVVEGGENKIALAMSATLDADNRLNFNDTITDISLYQSHKEEVDSDKDAWHKKVLDEIIGE